MDFDLDDVLSSVRIEGKSPFKKLEEQVWSEIPFWTSTGAVSLDYAIAGYKPGVKGGIPHGRCIEISGMESSAKSTLLDHIIRNFTNQHNGITLLGDRENAHEEDRLLEIGVDPRNLRFITKPNDEGQDIKDFVLEEYFEITGKAFQKIRERTDRPILAALDSLAVTLTRMQQIAIFGEEGARKGKGEIEFRPFNMREQNDKSIIMASHFPDFCSMITRGNGSLVIVNQLREKPGVMFGNPQYTPGGNTLNFMTSLHIRLSKDDEIMSKDDPTRKHRGEYPIGMWYKFKIVKNKIAPPLRTGKFPLYFDDRGIDYPTCLAQMLVDQKVWDYVADFEKSGAWYTWKEERIGQGMTNLIKTLTEDPPLAEEIEYECFGKKEEEE